MNLKKILSFIYLFLHWLEILNKNFTPSLSLNQNPHVPHALTAWGDISSIIQLNSPCDNMFTTIYH